MRIRTPLVALVLGAVASVPDSAGAQPSWTVTPYTGAYLPDDEATVYSPLVDPAVTVEVEPGLVAGVRMERSLSSAWSIEGTYAYTRYGTDARLQVTHPPGEPDPPDGALPPGTVLEHDETGHHLVGAVRFAPLAGRPLRPHLVAGLGVSRRTVGFPYARFVSELDDFDDERTETGLLAQIGGGVTWWTRPDLALRVDVRDHVWACEAFEGPCVRDVTLHDLEVSVGIELGPR